MEIMLTPVKLRGAEALMAEYADNLLVIPEAVGYVESRGLERADAENRLVGYCPPLSKPRSALLKGRIVVPIRSAHGEIVAFAGRQYEPAKELAVNSVWQAFAHKPKIALEQQRTWMRAKWWNESYPKQYHLYNLHDAIAAAREEGFIIIVEGYFDALVLSKLGIKNVVALCGANLSAFHAAKIKRYCDHVICLLDGDSAGEKGTARMVPILEAVSLVPHIFVLPEGMDPDVFGLKVGGKKLRKAFRHVIDNGLDVLRAKL
jgi:DNA primase